MTLKEKLRAHLEAIVQQDLPNNKKLNPAQLDTACQNATDEQHERARMRGLVQPPLLIGEERL